MKSNGRIGYNRGSCMNLKTSPYVLFIFIDDDESSWDLERVNWFWMNNVLDSLNFIEKQAKKYGLKLDIDKGCYQSNGRTSVKYKGRIVANLMEEKTNEDILDQAALSLGFDSKNEMHEYLKEYSKKDQIAYVLVVNKKGRSYANDYTQSKESNYLEHCIVFNQQLDGKSTCSAVIAHEILHLFGAEDYYDPYGHFPKRKEMAQNIYEDDIMLKVYREVSLNKIDKFTAYTIGWIDDLPNECDYKEWWE